MRTRHAVVLAVLVALAGCGAGYVENTPPQWGTETKTPTAASTTDGAAGAPGDPAGDRLGWENGRWANETLQLDRSDGLNETERDAVVNRAMARVEQVRRLEFKQDVPVELVSREEFQSGGSREYPDSLRQFDNAKFEALFLVDEDTDSLAVQQSNRGSSVAGFYVPSQDRIVVIYGGETPDLPGEGTLAHELVHALQDQHFDLGSITASTRDGQNANNGLIEGDANLVQDRYGANCGAAWSCLDAPAGGSGGGGDLHVGVYVLSFFPYSDGPGFVDYYQKRGGWERVNEMYADPPASAEQVIHPEKYAVDRDRPTDIRLADRTSDGWTRLRPEGRADAAVLGQSGIATMFAYTLYDTENEEQSVVGPEEFLNRKDGEIDRSDPFNYGFAAAAGWDGDRLHVYTKDDETAYVWKTAWDSPAEAEEFAAAYRDLLRHYGADRVAPGVYRIDSGPYADTFRVSRDSETVTVVNAPTRSALADVRS
ncbi:Hvo_1808 family surface protein [Halosegnis sp.]|uniref:Hvo_1808 family surface protein n=1 Tax=Halosegnis sp. TaxID=2864959 RepID=UPI0035D3E722